MAKSSKKTSKSLSSFGEGADEREKIKDLLLSKIKEEQQEIKILGESKGQSQTPRQSWSSHEVYDIEKEIFQHELCLNRYREILQSLENATSSREVGVGSIVTLAVEDKVNKYLFVKEGGEAIGEYSIISRQSPIGRKIWHKEVGEKVKVQTPQGTIIVKVLRVI